MDSLDPVLITGTVIALVTALAVFGFMRSSSAIIVWVAHMIMIPVLAFQEYPTPSPTSSAIQIAAFSLFLVLAWEAVLFRFSQAKKNDPYKDWKP